MRSAILLAAVCVSLASCGGADTTAVTGPAGNTGPTPPTADLTTATLMNAQPAPVDYAAFALLDPINGVRTGRGLASLTWSADLSREAADLGDQVETTTCSHSFLRRAVQPHQANTAYFFSVAVRKFDGASIAQTIPPAYVVSEWAIGADDYDWDAKTCRSGGRCPQFAAMVSETATSVGCSFKLCASQDQIWICRFRD